MIRFLVQGVSVRLKSKRGFVWSEMLQHGCSRIADCNDVVDLNIGGEWLCAVSMCFEREEFASISPVFKKG
jgi:hypothetical protein